MTGLSDLHNYNPTKGDDPQKLSLALSIHAKNSIIDIYKSHPSWYEETHRDAHAFWVTYSYLRTGVYGKVENRLKEP